MTISIQIVNQEPFGGRNIQVVRIDPGNKAEPQIKEMFREETILAPQIAHTFHIHGGVQLVIFEAPLI